MDLFLFHRNEYERLYNCSGFDAELIPIEQRTHTFHGIFLIILFFVFELLYIPCMMSMYNNLNNPCYKLLFYIGVTDMLVMLMNGFETGLLSIVGAVFCTYPGLIYTSGSIGLSLWFAAELLLAINRCLELVAPKYALRIYHGNRTWWLCVVPSVYALILSLYTPPILFTGLYLSWFFNPYVGYLDDFGQIYHNYMHTIHDMFVIFGLSAIYITFSVLLTIQTGSYHAQYQATLAQKLTFLQVVLISFFNGVAAGIYIYMQTVRISDSLVLIGTYAWLFAHGVPPLIYLALNKTIRTDFVRYVKIVLRRRVCHSHPLHMPTITATVALRGAHGRIKGGSLTKVGTSFKSGILTLAKPD
uniref:G protein-coupled receptor n=1 Tax=Globodera rostochiensis TaxID=31243 RepID=A0A914I832_GLORO